MHGTEREKEREMTLALPKDDVVEFEVSGSRSKAEVEAGFPLLWILGSSIL